MLINYFTWFNAAIMTEWWIKEFEQDLKHLQIRNIYKLQDDKIIIICSV